MDRKREAATRFVSIVARELTNRVYKIYLFGSVAKGKAAEESDIDILIILDRVDDRSRTILAEAAQQIWLESREPIEYISMDLEEYLSKRSDSPFIYEVEKYGEVLYMNQSIVRQRALKLARLAREYYEYSERIAKQLIYRAAIDLGYNAVELLIKALIIVSGRDLPRTHAGYIHVFGEIYVASGTIDREIIAELYRALERRNKARYDPDYEPTEIDAREILELYRRIEDIAERILIAEAL
ncbi:MAG: HEPN domain-containing protein [Sulfolobales archaeon]